MKTITIGELVIQPKITHKALKKLLEEDNIDLLDAFQKMVSGAGLDCILIEKIIYASIMHDLRVTQQFVEDNLNVDDYASHLSTIVEAFIESCPKTFGIKKKDSKKGA